MIGKRLARYEQIAIDIAARIAREDLLEGEKLSGRSTLSSDYSVSPETIRRALNLLSEQSCVEIINNYGVIVKNKSYAIAYLDSAASFKDVIQLKHRLQNLMLERQKIDEEMNKIIEEIVDLSSRFSYSDPLRRFEFKIEKNSPIINQSIRSSSFYQKTEMTIIAINRKGEMILSPGPDAKIKEDDVLVLVGHPKDVYKVDELVHPTKL